jgi:hypothetical protein
MTFCILHRQFDGMILNNLATHCSQACYLSVDVSENTIYSFWLQYCYLLFLNSDELWIYFQR